MSYVGTSSSYIECREPNKQVCDHFSIFGEFFLSDVGTCFVLSRFPSRRNCIGHACQPSKGQRGNYGDVVVVDVGDAHGDVVLDKVAVMWLLVMWGMFMVMWFWIKLW